MLIRNNLRFVSAALLFVIISYGAPLFAQQGSVYISVGYNQASFEPATIHVEQGELGNSYSMVNVKGDSKTGTSLSATQLNYRIGYYCNYEQTLGIELGFDPVDYRLKDGQTVKIIGTVNNTRNVVKTIPFSASNGYYYYYNSANLMLLNLVRRITVFRTNSKDLRVDAIPKIGAGPVLPHFQNSLPVNPTNDPQLDYGGWNVGGEAALRVTLKRYFYFEIAGKYDYANLNALNIYGGTAQQQLTTYEVVGCVGLTIPTTRYNPLFWRQRIITIKPLFEQMADSMETVNNDENDALSHFATGPMEDIPEFDEIVDKRNKLYDDSVKNVEDSLMMIQYKDSVRNADSIIQAEKLLNPATGDSTLKGATDTVKKADSTQNGGQENKRRRRHKKQKAEEVQAAPAAVDSAIVPVAVPPVQDAPAAPAAAPEPTPAPEAAPAPEQSGQGDTQDKKESRRERRRREKEEQKAREEKDQQQQPPDNSGSTKPDNNTGSTDNTNGGQQQ